MSIFSVIEFMKEGLIMSFSTKILIVLILVSPLFVGVFLWLQKSYYSTAASMIIVRSKALSKKRLHDMHSRGEINKEDYAKSKVALFEKYKYYELLVSNKGYISDHDLTVLKERLIENMFNLKNVS